MKSLCLALAAILVVPTSAFAIRLKDCPKTVKISLGNVSALTVEQIFAGADGSLNKELDTKDVEAIRSLLFDVRKVEATLNLKEATSAYCAYLPKSESKAYGDNETRLEHKAGRDILRVATFLGETPSRFFKGQTDKQNVWVYLNVENYSPDGIEISAVKGAKVLAWFDHGSPRYQFGWANNIEVK